MRGAGCYIIGELISAKVVDVLSVSECACHYGSKKKTKTLNGLVIGNINKPTNTGRAS